MFEWSLTLLLCKPKGFNAFQMLKWFSFLLSVTCVIFAHTINIDVWLSILASTTESMKFLQAILLFLTIVFPQFFSCAPGFFFELPRTWDRLAVYMFLCFHLKLEFAVSVCRRMQAHLPPLEPFM